MKAKAKTAYVVGVHVALAVVCALLAWSWFGPSHPSHHVSFVSKHGREIEKEWGAEGGELFEGNVFHTVMVDGEPIVEITEATSGLMVIAVRPEFSEYDWLFSYASDVFGMALPDAVTALPKDMNAEQIDSEIGRAQPYTYRDEDGDGMPELRFAMALPIDMDARAVRWRLVEQPWELWPWPEDEPASQAD